jgi:hypothetical protein
MNYYATGCIRQGKLEKGKRCKIATYCTSTDNAFTKKTDDFTRRKKTYFFLFLADSAPGI